MFWVIGGTLGYLGFSRFNWGSGVNWCFLHLFLVLHCVGGSGSGGLDLVFYMGFNWV